MELGDTIAAALKIAGITEERVSAWLGAPCGCGDRQAKLNILGRWAVALLTSQGVTQTQPSDGGDANGQQGRLVDHGE